MELQVVLPHQLGRMVEVEVDDRMGKNGNAFAHMAYCALSSNGKFDQVPR